MQFSKPLASFEFLTAVVLKIPLSNEITPWTRVLPEKLTGAQLVKKFPAFYGTRSFFTAFTRARQLFLSRATSIHSMPPIPLLEDPF
jgi:hypothetical protein